MLTPIFIPRDCDCANCQVANKYQKTYQAFIVKNSDENGEVDATAIEFIQKCQENDDKYFVCLKKDKKDDPSVTVGPSK